MEQPGFELKKKNICTTFFFFCFKWIGTFRIFFFFFKKKIQRISLKKMGRLREGTKEIEKKKTMVDGDQDKRGGS